MEIRHKRRRDSIESAYRRQLEFEDAIAFFLNVTK